MMIVLNRLGSKVTVETDGVARACQVVEPVLPEDPYSGMFTQHGYASHTPVSDGQRVYAYFGKTGMVAFDLDGKRLWQKSLGTESGPQGWGSASSPIVYNHLIIATASAESEALVALNKETGEEGWRKEAAGFSGTWGTPVLVDCGGGRTDLVLAVPFEMWGFNPEDGKLRWYCESVPSDSMCSSALVHEGVVYAMESGPRGGGTVAVRAGGRKTAQRAAPALPGHSGGNGEQAEKEREGGEGNGSTSAGRAGTGTRVANATASARRAKRGVSILTHDIGGGRFDSIFLASRRPVAGRLRAW